MAARANPHQFYLDVLRFNNLAEEVTLEVHREAIVDIQRELVRRTPVRDGWLRGSWYSTLGGTPKGPMTQVNPLIRLNRVARRLKAGQNYVMGNVAPYARRLEHGFVGRDSLGRNYEQQGRHFVRLTLMEAPAIASATARRLARRTT